MQQSPLTVSSSAAEGPVALVRPMRAVLRAGGLCLLFAVPVVGLIGLLLDGRAGLWGALLGLVIPAFFFAVTAAVALATAKSRPDVLGMAVLGTWLIKIIAVVGFLAALSSADFYNRMILFLVLVVGVVGFLVMEAVVVVRTKVPYVEPAAS